MLLPADNSILFLLVRRAWRAAPGQALSTVEWEKTLAFRRSLQDAPMGRKSGISTAWKRRF
jgi:hypothetical protein